MEEFTEYHEESDIPGQEVWNMGLHLMPGNTKELNLAQKTKNKKVEETKVWPLGRIQIPKTVYRTQAFSNDTGALEDSWLSLRFASRQVY